MGFKEPISPSDPARRELISDSLQAVYLLASIKVTKLLIDFDIALSSLGVGHRHLVLSAVDGPQPLVVAVHLPVRKVDRGFAILRYGRRQGTAIHLHIHLLKTFLNQLLKSIYCWPKKKKNLNSAAEILV